MSALNPITLPPVTIDATAKVTSTPKLTPPGATSTAPIVWTPGDPAVGTLTIAHDESSAEVVPVAPGNYVLGWSQGDIGFQLTIPFAAPVIAPTGVDPNITVTA